MRYINLREDAEEIMLQGFEKFFRQCKSFLFQGEGAFTNYLKKAMINECLMFLRKRKIVFEEIDTDTLMQSPGETVIENLSSKEIFELIRRLPQGYRTVFNLFIMEQLSHKEISQLLGISEGTSKSQLSKARILLQKMIKTNEK